MASPFCGSFDASSNTPWPGYLGGGPPMVGLAEAVGLLGLEVWVVEVALV